MISIAVPALDEESVPLSQEAKELNIQFHLHKS